MKSQLILAAIIVVLAAVSFENTAFAEGAVTHGRLLREIRYTKDEVDDWFAGKAFPFSKHHPKLGWLLPNRKFKDGIDDSVSVYTYSETGERVMINYADRPCRINTYGDSFTQCHQVSDGETWQEVLAAHLQEPVRNFGIGGWSVYQAYLRMKMEEKKTPAELIILNIYWDDHYRNLDSWRNIRQRKHQFHIESALPYLKVDLKTGACTEYPNMCPTQQSYYNFCNVDWLVEHFKDDFVLNIVLAKLNAEKGNHEYAYKLLEATAAGHGLDKDDIDRSRPAKQIAKELHTRAALLSTMKIVEWVEEYAKANNKKVLYVLSYSDSRIIKYSKKGERFDRKFVDLLKKRKLPVVDLLQAHIDDYQGCGGDIEKYVGRYYVGHYNPLGNLFTAFAIKDKVTQMLEPKPIPYQD
ncbi:MAG: SGNH/GDSL hydrolase family protein [Planctomycetota bacterium]|jgi:hypothetical protein